MKASGLRFCGLAVCLATACLGPSQAIRAEETTQTAGGDQSGPGLEEIIVTAQRRQERLQDVQIGRAHV